MFFKGVGMNHKNRILLIVFLLGGTSLSAHQPSGEGGVFQKIVERVKRQVRRSLLRKTISASKVHPKRSFEKRLDGTDSRVFLVYGKQNFDNFVVGASKKMPVIVKIFTDKSSESQRMKNVYQKLADEYKGKVNFVAVNVGQSNHENLTIVSQIGKELGLPSIKLPSFLFYWENKLHTPMPMAQGFHSAEDFRSILDNKFKGKISGN